MGSESRSLFERAKQSLFRGAVPLAAASLAISACGSMPPKAQSQGEGGTTSTTAAEVTADGVYEADGSDWHIVCYGEQPGYVVEGGSLSQAIEDAPVQVGNPSGLGQKDIPHEALVQAVAEVAGLEDPDYVQVGRIVVPQLCIIQP